MHLIESQPVAPSALSLAGSPPGFPATLHYSAYGLRVQSEFPLPEFIPVARLDSAPDVTVNLGQEDEWIAGVRHEPNVWAVGAEDARFWFKGVGGFHVRHGREIIVSPEPRVEEGLLRLYVEGMMMASLLRQRGFFVLHASVVQIGDAAIAFLGYVGAGKSSAAAALHARGRPVVTDDNAAIDLSLPGLKVLPAFPTVKVYPKIAAALGYGEDSLVLMHESQPKKARSVSDAFPSVPVPLKAIYVLTRGGEDGFAPLSRSNYMLELIRNSVPTRWGQAGDARHLQECARLAAMIPAWRVRTFDTPEELPEMALRIERHCCEALGQRA